MPATSKCAIIGHHVGDTMHISRPKFVLASSLILLLLGSNDAFALRCGNKLVKDGMHELQVRAICGEPVATQWLGYVLRYYDPRGNRSLLSYSHHLSYGARQELPVVEMLFNFGPHKLMRRLRFEGGRLTSVETEGYGYRKKD